MLQALASLKCGSCTSVWQLGHFMQSDASRCNNLSLKILVLFLLSPAYEVLSAILHHRFSYTSICAVCCTLKNSTSRWQLIIYSVNLWMALSTYVLLYASYNPHHKRRASTIDTKSTWTMKWFPSSNPRNESVYVIIYKCIEISPKSMEKLLKSNSPLLIYSSFMYCDLVMHGYLECHLIS